MEIRNVGIIGTGVMGTGIARCAALRGYDVTIVKWTDGSPDEARDRFESAVAKDRERGKLSLEERIALLTRIAWTTARERLAECDLVIESIVEDEDEKRACFRALDAAMKPEAILASNTSTLVVGDLAKATRRPERVLGLHFFNPVEAMELVEVPTPEGVAAEARDAALGFARALGKQAFVVADSPGFVVNRLLMSSPLEAVRMAFEQRPRVADIETVDACVRLGLRHPMGPFQLMDLIGIDVMYGMGVSLQEGLRKEQFAPPRLLERMLDRGWIGRKAGLGFYDYADRKHPRPNPALEQLASE